MSVEYAAGTRAPARSSPFPAEWSERQAPPADPVGIAAWIASNLRGARPLLPGIEVGQAPPAKATDPRQALVALRRREAP